MTSRIEPYRVSAYNTALQSENKIHDDTVARRFGFSGGLVPGVDVMAYMIHLPVAKWGRDFLERGLIEARFVKPVYDGETADVTGEEKDGVLTIAVESRGQLCATGSASLPASAPSMSIADFSEAAPVAERRPVVRTWECKPAVGPQAPSKDSALRIVPIVAMPAVTSHNKLLWQSVATFQRIAAQDVACCGLLPRSVGRGRR